MSRLLAAGAKFYVILSRCTGYRVSSERKSPTDGHNVIHASRAARGGLLIADRSGDGKTSLSEAMAYASDIAASSSRIRSLPELQELLALDPNAYGKLTIEELGQIANNVFDRYDLDRDDILAPAEKLAVGNDTEVAAVSRLLQSRAAAYNFPKATADQRVYAMRRERCRTLQ